MLKTFVSTTSLFLLLLSFFSTQAQVNQNCTGSNTITGSCASGLGINNIVSGAQASASGNDNQATGAQSFVVGLNARALGNQSFAAGRFVQATNTNSMILGSGLFASSPLTNNIANSLLVSFGSTSPTLFVGPGSGSSPGKIGLGMSNPQRRLDVSGSTRIVSASVGSSTPSLEISGANQPGITLKSQNNSNNNYKDALFIDVNNGTTKAIRVLNSTAPQNTFTAMEVNAVGNGYLFNSLNIGPNCTDVYDDQNKFYRLTVDGRIRAREIKVTSNGWCDYVFADDYELMPLEEVEAYITQNQHLPKIPTAAQVDTHGIELGKMQTRMMEKIEELTLYVIELNKSNQALQAEVADLKSIQK